MPAGKGGGGGSDGNPAHRTTFRPPWVKDGSNSPTATQTAPWSLKSRRDSGADADSQTRRSSLTKGGAPHENGTATNKESTFVKPQLKPVPPKEPSKPAKENKLPPVKLNSVADRKPLTRMPTKDDEKPKIPRQESLRKVSLTPAPPPMPPPAPAMPKPINAQALSRSQQEKLEQLKSRPKTRPDWTSLLKEVESGRKLKHVECNDRSKPLLPQQKAKGQFLYESEQQNAHNVLLKQIQQGIHLKQVKTNDRSKPILEGLRKFRRQMTIEEQIQKSQSMASIPPEEIIADEVDEMDDIDKVRDDLQSTKQMLAIELRNKEAQIRENKRLQARIQNLEVELEKERSHTRDRGHSGPNEVDEKLIIALKIEAAEARKATVELEKKLRETNDELDGVKSDLENTKKQNQALEKKLQDAAQGKRVSISEKKDGAADENAESEEELVESESESDGEDNEEKRERRAQREIKMLRNKLRNFKNKEDNAKKERAALKEIMKGSQTAMKEEKKRYKTLQKEVDKMASLMKDTSSDSEDAEEEEDEDEEEKEAESDSESSESESESDESSDDSESERSQSEPEDAPSEKKKENLTKRSRRHENILAALKKGNFMLKTNVERLQDDLNKQKELTITLQEDLDSVLAELG